MYHYSMLMTEPLKVLYWISKRSFKSRLKWFLKVYKYYTYENEKYWMKKTQDLTNHYGFWFLSENIEESNGHGLYVFKGNHPDLIENSNLIKIKDFRQYYKLKPYYKSYLATLKEIVEYYKKNALKRRIQDVMSKILNYLERKYHQFEQWVETD